MMNYYIYFGSSKNRSCDEDVKSDHSLSLTLTKLVSKKKQRLKKAEKEPGNVLLMFQCEREEDV